MKAAFGFLSRAAIDNKKFEIHIYQFLIFFSNLRDKLKKLKVPEEFTSLYINSYLRFL